MIWPDASMRLVSEIQMVRIHSGKDPLSFEKGALIGMSLQRKRMKFCWNILRQTFIFTHAFPLVPNGK